ncbi:MAG: hypothetical protein KF774_19425 [Planctomyces sp.]|nr:hypothetical protein [Planctomyces sp.]
MLVQGDKFRFDTPELLVQSADKASTVRKSRAFVEGVHRTYASGADGGPGTLTLASSQPEWKLLQLYPLPLYCRFSKLDLPELESRNYKVESSSHEGRDCWLLTTIAAPPRSSDPRIIHFNVVRSFWVDVETLCVLRMETTQSGESTVSMYVHYSSHPELETVPSEWIVESRSGSAFVDISRWELDPRVDGSDFEIEIPPGTFVVDARDRAKVDYYSVHADGAWLPSDEYRTVAAAPSVRRWNGGRWIWACVATLLLVAAGAAVRIQRGKQQ